MAGGVEPPPPQRRPPPLRRRPPVRSRLSPLSPRERLLFARQVLFALALIALIIAVLYINSGEEGAAAAVFEFVKVGLLPLAVLIVSFYFPREQTD